MATSHPPAMCWKTKELVVGSVGCKQDTKEAGERKGSNLPNLVYSKSPRSRLHPSAWLAKRCLQPHMRCHKLPDPYPKAVILGVTVESGALELHMMLVITLQSRGFICGQFMSHRSWGKESNNWSSCPFKIPYIRTEELKLFFSIAEIIWPWTIQTSLAILQLKRVFCEDFLK